MNDLEMSRVTPSEGDIVIVSAPTASQAEIAELQERLDDQFKASGARPVVVGLPLTVHALPKPTLDELLWVGVEEAGEKEVQATQDLLEDLFEKDVRGPLVVSNFAPEWTTLTHDELLGAQAHIEVLLDYTSERRPHVVVSSPVEPEEQAMDTKTTFNGIPITLKVGDPVHDEEGNVIGKLKSWMQDGDKVSAVYEIDDAVAKRLLGGRRDFSMGTKSGDG